MDGGRGRSVCEMGGRWGEGNREVEWERNGEEEWRTSEEVVVNWSVCDAVLITPI